MWFLGLWFTLILETDIHDQYEYPVKPFDSILIKNIGIPPNIDYYLDQLKRLRVIDSKIDPFFSHDGSDFENGLISFNNFGPPLVPSSDLFVADKYLKDLVEDLRRKFFPDLVTPINILLTEAGNLASCLYIPKADFFLLSFSRELFSIVESEEQLIFVVLHELIEGLRRKRFDQEDITGLTESKIKIAREAAPSTLPATHPAWKVWFKRYGKDVIGKMSENQAKEVQIDAKAIQLLIEMGRNPSDAGRFMEHLAFVQKDRPDFFATHPISEGRASALNAVAEKAMAKRQFPPLTQLPDSIKQLRTPQSQALHVYRDINSFGYRLGKSLERAGGSMNDLLFETNDRFWNFINFISFPSKINDRFMRLNYFWHLRVVDTKRKGFSIQDFFKKVSSETLNEIIFPILARSVTGDLIERPSPIGMWLGFKVEFMNHSPRQARILWDQIDLEIQRRYPHFRWVSLRQEEINLLDHLSRLKDFKDLSNFYALWEGIDAANQTKNGRRYGSAAGDGSFSFVIEENSEKILEILRVYSVFVITHGEKLKKVLASSSPEDIRIQKEFIYFRDRLYKILYQASFQMPLIIDNAARSIRNEIKDSWLRVLAFPGRGFDNPVKLESAVQSNIFKESGSEWIDQIKNIQNIQDYITAFRQTAVTWISAGRGIYSSRGLFKIFVAGLKNFIFGIDEIEGLLSDSIYWPIAENKNVREAFPDYFKDEVFWKEQILSTDLQTTIYDRLKELNELGNPEYEFRWWTKFVKQSVTPFTDQWAERIFDETEAGPKRNRLAVQFWNGGRIKSKALRLKIFKEILEGEGRYDEIGKFSEGSNERNNAIESCLLDIFHHFPESSFEKSDALDQIATRFRSSLDETRLIYEWSKSETDFSPKTRSASSFNLVLADGVGVRLISQVFSELSRKPWKVRLEFLKFLIGSDDSAFSMRLADEVKDEDENYHRVRNVLFHNFHNFSEPALYFTKYYFGFETVKAAFKLLHPSVLTVLIDSLMVGPGGLLRQNKSRNELIKYLFEEQREWSGLAKDLLEGLRRSVRASSQSHQDTLIVSFLLAASANRSLQKFHIGALLREFFSANTALNKTGQEIHSSRILPEEINNYLEDLKDKAAWISRNEIYDWLLAASTTVPPEDALKNIVLGKVLAVASVKVAVEAWVNGIHKVLYIVRPNAVAMGDSSFSILEGAVQYAISKGHQNLKPIVPMLRRGREILRRELDLVEERTRALKMAALYENGPFVAQIYDPAETLEFDPRRVASVDYKDFIPFQDLSKFEQSAMAEEIGDREWNILVESKASDSSGNIDFDRDRHEKNYLRLRAENESGRTLVFDPGQLTSILETDRDRLWAALESTESYNQGLISKSNFVANLAKHFEYSIDEKSILNAVANSPYKISPVRLSVILSNLQGLNAAIPDSWLDYLKALNTVSTWDKYLPEDKKISTRMRKRIGGALEAQFAQTNFRDRCRIGLRRLFSSHLER